MKRILILIITLSVLMLMSVTASANDWHRDRNFDRDRNWHQTHHNDIESERDLPFAWHERYDSMREHHHLERVYDRGMEHRFPGLHAYRWSSHRGFWHHGNYVEDAIFFYDRNNELISVGYMHDGVFIHFRDDHESYENHDSFFLSWFHR